MNDVVMAVDVGSGSARAGLFSLDGRLVGTHAASIRQWRPQAEFVEQSSSDIWAAVTAAVRAVIAAAGPGVVVRGIGFGLAAIAMTTANYAYYLHVVRGSQSWNLFEGYGKQR